MGCYGGFSLDEAKRSSWYSPNSILSDLKAGNTFVDIGCGDGFFSVLASKIVGAEGKIYAVDIDSSSIDKLQNKAKSEGLSNIITKVGKAEDTVFCVGCADSILCSMDLHDFNDPIKVLSNARTMIKPSGLLIDLDWKKQDLSFGPPESIRFSEKKAIELIEAADFTVGYVGESGPYHYLIKAKPQH